MPKIDPKRYRCTRLKDSDRKNAIAKDLGYKNFFLAVAGLHSKDYTIRSIAATFSMSPTGIYKVMKGLGIQQDPAKSSRAPRQLKFAAEKHQRARELGYKDYFDACDKLYFEKNLTLTKVGELLGVTYCSIRWCIKHYLKKELRPWKRKGAKTFYYFAEKQARAEELGYPDYETGIFDLYENKGLSYRETGKVFGVTGYAIAYRLKRKHGNEISRSRGGANYKGKG